MPKALLAVPVGVVRAIPGSRMRAPSAPPPPRRNDSLVERLSSADPFLVFHFDGEPSNPHPAGITIEKINAELPREGRRTPPPLVDGFGAALGFEPQGDRIDELFFNLLFLAARRITHPEENPQPLRVTQFPNVREKRTQARNARSYLMQRFSSLGKVRCIFREPDGASTMELDLRPDQVAYDDESSAETWAYRLKQGPVVIAKEVLKQIDKRSSPGKRLTLSILATEGAVAKHVLSEMFQSLGQQDNKFDNLDIRLCLSSWRSPSYHYGSKQMLSKMTVVLQELQDLRLLERMARHGITLGIWTHPYPPILHGLCIDTEWAACGIAGLSTIEDYDEQQFTCWGLDTNFMLVELGESPEGDTLLDGFRGWSESMIRPEGALGTCGAVAADEVQRRKAAGSLAERLKRWLDDMRAFVDPLPALTTRTSRQAGVSPSRHSTGTKSIAIPRESKRRKPVASRTAERSILRAPSARKSGLRASAPSRGQSRRRAPRRKP